MQKNLLFIHQGAIGDIVSLFPAIIKLKNKFNRIDAICNKNTGELACTLNLTNKAWPVEAAFFSSMFSGNVDPVAKEILGSYDDILLFSYSHDLEKTVRSISKKAVYRVPPRPDANHGIHISEYFLKHLLQNKLINNDNLPEKEYDDYLTKEINNAKAKKNGLKIIIHPGSGSKRKNWPVSNFIKVYRDIELKGISPEILIGPAEYDLIDKFKKHLPSNGIIHTPSQLTELVPLLKQGTVFIGNDSGISHLAAFMGIPAIVIFGPSDPVRWKPFGRFVKVIRSQTDCRPCFETGNSDCKKDSKCLNEIAAETVLNTLYSGMFKNNIGT